MATLRASVSVLVNGVTVVQSGISATSTGLLQVEEAVADAQTDKLIVAAIDVSALQGLFIMSTQDLTLETNSGSEPDDTLELVAGAWIWWAKDQSAEACPLTADVVGFYATNASGAEASVTIIAVQDATP